MTGRRGEGKQMRVAAVQLNSSGDKERNLETASRLVAAAAAEGAQLIGLPEKWNLLAAGDELVAGAEALEGPTLTAAAGWARELGIHLLAGSIAERVEGEQPVHNTSTLFGPAGELLAVYRKIHLFDVDVEGVRYRESDRERAGEEIVVATAGGVEVGMTICYDLRFPEVCRKLAVEHQANLFVNSSAWPFPRVEHLRVLALARAMENQVYVVIANRVGTDDGVMLCGSSVIVDPYGVILAASSADREEIIYAEISKEIVDLVRERMRLFDHRRPELYGAS
jgi:predicted amidohydrolase